MIYRIVPSGAFPYHIDGLPGIVRQVLDGKVSTFVCDVSGQNAHQVGPNPFDVKLHEIHCCDSFL